MDVFTVTVGQLILSGAQSVYDQINRAFGKYPDADLLVFPEFATRHNVDLKAVPYLQGSSEAAEKVQRWLDLVPDFTHVKALSEDVGKALLIGCIAQDNGQLFSRAYFYDPHRAQLGYYDKSHIHWTEDFLRPGGSIVPLQTRFGTIGILMCYDMAFSEAPRVLGIQGVEVLFALSAIPSDFCWQYAHHRMIGAAIFNQYYVVAANVGHSPETPMGGHSGVYGPKGDLIAQIEGAHAGCLCAEVDLDQVRRWRHKEIIYPHRRPYLYRQIAAPVDDR